MKSPLAKLRKFALHETDVKENWDHRLLNSNGLSQAAKDLKDMRAFQDRLLFAAAAAANSAYEFSESLLEMGNCLMEKITRNDNGESGRALFMLGGVQLQLQKLVDNYRSHIVHTITDPSESILSELRKVEEMKLNCDEKREFFEHMVRQHREKGRSRHGKGQIFTSQQLQVAHEEYDEASRLYIFRLESLKQGQSWSLLTQAARHHAAQINLFQRGLSTLVALEPHIADVAGKQHIDYKLCGSGDVEKSYNKRSSLQTNDDGEICFDYRQTEEQETTCASRSSMQINFGKNQSDKISCPQPRESSHSAPIYSGKFDPAERVRELPAVAVQKLNTYVLPTPGEKSSSNSAIQSTPSSSGGNGKNLWHSSPLDTKKHRKFKEHNFPTTADISVKENSKSPFVPLPRPLAEGDAVSQWDTQSVYDIQKIRRPAFSSPLPSKSSYVHSSIPLPQPASSTNVLGSSPKITELHELPWPPGFLVSKPVHSSAVFGHSAHLINRNREVSPTNKSPVLSPKIGSSLPLPPLTMPQCFSIPSSHPLRAMETHAGKLLGSSQFEDKMEEATCPPLTPILLSNMKSPDSGQISKFNTTLVPVSIFT